MPDGRHVTFLFTDIEGSTPLWENARSEMEQAVARHEQLLGGAIEAHDGRVVKTLGDGLYAVFAHPAGAVAAAIGNPDVVKLITEGFKVMVILLPAIGMALYRREPSALGGTLSVSGGLIAWAVLFFVTAISEWAYVVGFIAAAVIVIFTDRIEYFMSQARSRSAVD